MAVCAAHFTLPNLFDQGSKARPAGQQSRDFNLLVPPDVIEVQDVSVRLSAIYAVMISKVGIHPLSLDGTVSTVVRCYALKMLPAPIGIGQILPHVLAMVRPASLWVLDRHLRLRREYETK
jgi:hypothetical protein